MRAKQMFSTGAHIVALAALIACKGKEPVPAGQGALPATKPFRVALLTPGPISDQSWNGGAYQGLLRLARQRRDTASPRSGHAVTSGAIGRQVAAEVGIGSLRPGRLAEGGCGREERSDKMLAGHLCA